MAPYWSFEEEKRLTRMVDEEKPLEEMAEALNRTREAVQMKIRRLGLKLPEKSRAKTQGKKEVKTEATTTTLPAITPAEKLISLREMMLLMVGVINRLQNPENLSNLELKRCRIIVSAARNYMKLLDTYQRWSDIEQRMVDMEARFLERYKRDLRRETNPDEKAKLEKQIKQLEENLKDNKFYKPFQKKPSLMGPNLKR